MPIVVGSVPYVNAIPLTLGLEAPGSGVRVAYDVPSALPARLDSGEFAAILVSIYDALSHPGRRVAAGVCIGSEGPVQSVRLFSRVPLSKIRTLALDASSLTSNALARILLAEQYGVRPEVFSAAPDLAAMLGRADACVLIGDIGMEADGTGLHVLDLGEAWTDATGLPFVWAAWVGGDALTSDLVAKLYAARHAFPSGRGADLSPELLDHAGRRCHWPREVLEAYLYETMVYDLDERGERAIRLYAELLARHGLAHTAQIPQFLRLSATSAHF